MDMRGLYYLAIMQNLARVYVPFAYPRKFNSAKGFAIVEWPGGISPPGPHRSVHEPLDSHGSCQPSS